MSDPYGPKRDRWGRYVLPDPDTGKERSWTRATTLASTLADTHGLTKWKLRMVAKGLGMRADLLALAASAPIDDKSTLDKVADQAMEIAGSSAGANSGTALHSFTETLDRGEDPQVPAPWDADVRAYRQALGKAKITTHPEWVERIVINPQFGVAGTLDRIVTLDGGRRVIGDLKTGRDLSYSWPEIAIQLALYATASHMWNGTGWDPMPVLDPNEAVVFHLPVGQAMCQLFTVDTAAGWEMADIAVKVRQWRARRDLHRTLGIAVEPENNARELAEKTLRQAANGLLRQVENAATVDELVQLWAKHDADGTWTPELTAAAAARKATLQVA